MTITDDQRDEVQSRVADFYAQPNPDDCLPTAIKNALDDLAERKGRPELSLSLSELNEALEYEEGHAARSDRIASRVDPLIEDENHEVMVGSPIPEQLQQIVQSEETSLPVCEVDSEYFEYVDQGYNPEAGRDGYGRYQHVVVPMAFNDETVLVHDPFIHHFNRTLEDNDEGIELPYNTFYEVWQRPEKRWTFWIRPRPQQTLTASIGGNDGNQ